MAELMEIRITRGLTFPECNPYIRVDFYKTHEAYLYPEDHPDDVWNACCSFDPNDPTKPNELDTFDRLLNIIEASVNSCLEGANK